MLPEIRQAGFAPLIESIQTDLPRSNYRNYPQKKNSNDSKGVTIQETLKILQQYSGQQPFRDERFLENLYEGPRKSEVQRSSLPQIYQKQKAISMYKTKLNSKSRIKAANSNSPSFGDIGIGTFKHRNEQDTYYTKGHAQSQAQQKYLHTFQLDNQVSKANYLNSHIIPKRFGSVSPETSSPNSFYNSNLVFGNKSKGKFDTSISAYKAATSKYYRKVSSNPFRVDQKSTISGNDNSKKIESPKRSTASNNSKNPHRSHGYNYLNKKKSTNIKIPHELDSPVFKQKQKQIMSLEKIQHRESQNMQIRDIQKYFETAPASEEKQVSELKAERSQQNRTISRELNQTPQKQQLKEGLAKTKNSKAKIPVGNYSSSNEVYNPPAVFKKIPDKRDEYQKNRHNTYIQKESYFDSLITKGSLVNYKMKSHIGKGCFSIVSQAIDRVSNISYAVKTYNKYTDLDWYRLESIKKEISNLSLIQHQNIVQLAHVVKDKQKILLVMENAGKTSLAGVLRKENKLTETIAKFYFRQICEAVKHCHEKGICHRDLKPENILIDQNQNIKLIDFGFSTQSKAKLNNFCGTPPFMSPEITKKQPYVGQFSDIWALGVLLYMMTHGKFPFRANSQQELYRMIQQGKYKIDSQISSDAREVLSKTLKVIPQERSSVQNLLNCRWFGKKKLQQQASENVVDIGIV